MLEKYSIAWEFHNNTVRWEHNVLPVNDEQCTAPVYKDFPNKPLILLEEYSLPDVTLEKLLFERYSCRKFDGEKIPLKKLSLILKRGYGILNKTLMDNLEFHERPVPSGGALYPLEIYVLVNHIENLEPGIYHYNVFCHGLEQLKKIVLPKFLLSNLFMNQPYIGDSAAIFMITSVVERNMIKYLDRGYRYILFEAGHLAQNVNLSALALGLGSLNLGGFFDNQVADLLGIDIEEEIPLYGIAIGNPVNGFEKNELRNPSI